SKDPFWENKAQDLITAAIAVECMDKTPEKRQFANVISYCYGVNWNEMKNKMLESPIRAMQNSVQSLMNTEIESRNTLEGIRQQAQSFLSVSEGAKMERATRDSDWHPLDLRKQPATIYIGLKVGEIDTYSSVLRVFIAQHLRALFQELPTQESQEILFMLDEFPRLKYMSEIEEALDVGRQYKIKLFLVIQYIEQVVSHYKSGNGLIGSCAVRAFMNPSGHDGSAKKLSEELGKMESIVDGSQHNIADMTDLTGSEYANDVIILSSGNKPIRATKHFAYQDEELTKRMSIPAPIINRNPTGRLIQD
ncbi:MAG: type IV secretory system conjugative DNA transfer family protein, partial [Xanthomonadales bacterium]|nr:type IV secretory system conjugative DNA transfer family protein [Xanthomonadales bacterium]